MKVKFTNIIQRPIFLLLLPMFYFLHTVLQNFSLILVKDAFILLAVYSVASLILASLFWFLFKNPLKASLAAFFIMAYNFFFGSAYDFLNYQFRHPFFIKFSFILPVTLLVFIILIVYLKKSKRTFLSIVKYLNLVLIVLILIDTAAMLIKISNYKGHHVENLSVKFTDCDTCTNPDIYLIVTDEYAGKKELMDLFAFDNSSFENELQKKGFHVISNSTSNYNATVYSMASMLNIDYLNFLNKPEEVNHPDMLICRRLIKNNTIISFLISNGYVIYNHSFFDIAKKKKAVHNYYFQTKTSFFTHSTFTHRMISVFGGYFASQKKIDQIKKNNLYNDIKIASLTRDVAKQKNTKPKFVYTHFYMPHHSYYLDSNGKEIDFENKVNADTSKKAYVGYLVYTNKILLEMIGHIKNNSTKPPVIILISDHGFRNFADGIDIKYAFMNLNAVYLPNGNYSEFYDGMSNVNLFRVILNMQFGQNLSLLKDSSSFLIKP